MCVQLFGLGGDGKQVYEWRGPDDQDLKQLAKDMINNSTHIHQVVAVKNVPNVQKFDNSFHISYTTQFLFIEERQPSPEEETE